MQSRRWFALNFSALALSLCSAGYSIGQPAQPRKLLIVGDSLSAEYGLQRGKGWVALLDAQLKAERLSTTVINGSISGDTTSGGRARLPALLKQHQPTHLVIELGGNDALRGLPMQSTRDNLIAMIDAAHAAGTQVLLFGMQLPPNYGAAYGKEFSQTFSQVAKTKSVALVPFFLKGIADISEPLKYFQADRIHPNEAAQPIMLTHVWPAVRSFLQSKPAQKAKASG